MINRTHPRADADPVAVANRLLADAWEQVRSSPYACVRLEGRLKALPDLGPAAAETNAEAARQLLARIDALELDVLPPALSVPLRQARYGAQVRSHAGDWYWTVIDPSGVGFYGEFLPSAYCGGFILNFAFEALGAARFELPGDFDRHLGLVSDLARLIDQMGDRTLGQAERGMLMPKPQIPAARALLAAFSARSAAGLGEVADARIAPSLRGDATVFRADLKRRVDTLVLPAFARLSAVIDERYEAAAPETVGLGQYPGGAEIYRELLKLHTTLDLTPEEVHEAGLARLQTIEAAMRSIRAEVGLADDPAAYLSRAHADPRFSADTEDEVATVFGRYIERMQRAFESSFHRAAKAPHGVAPLPQALQGSMTFGYYDAPRPGKEAGHFLFNGGHLTKTPLLGIAALTYHELVPGHHLHLATQQENESLHPISRYSFCNAFNEGWAEYAATLAGEMGMYSAPEERYGRCIMDAFLTCRLVVDTGMNAFGWSLDRARQFLRDHSAMSEAEIRSETLRYSCDIPGQALAYKLGDTEIMALRERLRDALHGNGSELDLRDFHAAVLAHGAMPLPDLAREVERQLL